MEIRKATDVFHDWALAGKDLGMEKGHSYAVNEMLNFIFKEAAKMNKNFSAIDVGCGNGWVVRLIDNHELCDYAEGIDGAKAGMIEDNGEAITKEVAIAGDEINDNAFAALKEQSDWWESNKEFAAEDKAPVEAATLYGSRMALRVTALVPASMAVLYLLLILGFKAPVEESDSSSGAGEAAAG